MNIYVASSWRNIYQPGVVKALRSAGHAVYDFRNPPGSAGFAWGAIDPNWRSWSVSEFAEHLEHEDAIAGFNADIKGLRDADACVLVLPCGRSAHLEAGWAVGSGRELIVYSPEPCEPELMYRWARAIVGDVPALLDAVAQAWRAAASKE